MILATHALTGAVMGKTINNPGLIIIVSLTVHFLMDMLRHGEYFDDRYATVRNTWWKVFLDITTVFLVIYVFIFLKNPNPVILKNIILGSFISMLPDGLTLLYRTFPKIKILGKIKQFHAWAHRYSRFPKHSPERQWTLRNAVNDIIISAIAIFILFL